MKTAEQSVLAKPAVWCSRASPGGGTYSVSSSNDFARATSASSEPGSGATGSAGGASPQATKSSSTIPGKASRVISTSGLAFYRMSGHVDRSHWSRAPDVGEVTDTAPVHQSDVAATILKLLGLDYRELDPEAGPPIGVAFRDSEVLTK